MENQGLCESPFSTSKKVRALASYPRPTLIIVMLQGTPMAKKPTQSRSEPSHAPRASAQPKSAVAAEGPSYAIGDPGEFARNMVRVGIQSQRLLADFLKRQASRMGSEPFDPLNLTGAFSDLLRGMVADPSAVMEAQFDLWRDYIGLWERTARRMMGGEVEPMVTPAAGDRRFRDKEWRENQIFDFIKQSYLLTANWLQNTVARVDHLDPQARRRVEFYTKQFVDAFAPTNFVLTNPEVLRATLQSNGENLVQGLNNLLEDLDRGEGRLSIRQTADAFVVGKNIATTPGKVIFRNDLIELLQFSPTTDEVYERPLLIYPPWINKYYILDLRPENSFIRWMVAQGYTVFVASWVNPDSRLARKTFEDYMREGIFAGLDAVRDATGVRDPNLIGYCIGGTLLAATLGYMAAKKDDRIHSATFFAAQADFSEAGDLQVFIDDVQLEALQQQMESAGGILEGGKMATTFNMLRANDLIWSFVVNNYLLGKAPVPFDLLYWNSDTTRMPEATHLFYLRQFYKNNALAKGNLKLGGELLDLGKVTLPIYLQSAKDDHIAPYRSVYNSTRLFKGPIRFILASSGHIAGVINPPDAMKYQYWTNDNLPATIEQWQAGAKEHAGSWWPDWNMWLAPLSGRKIPAPNPGDAKLNVLGDAPGTYVAVKAQ